MDGLIIQDMKKNKHLRDKLIKNDDEIEIIHQYQKFLRMYKIDRWAWDSVIKMVENRHGLLDNYPTSEAVTTPIPF